MFCFGIKVGIIKKDELVQPYCGFWRCEGCVVQMYPGGARIHQNSYLMVEDPETEADFRMYIDADISRCGINMPSGLGQSRKINSCRRTRFKANVYIKDLNFYALRDIVAGEELLADYPYGGAHSSSR